MTPSELFRLTNLVPVGTKPAGDGFCSCGDFGPLYRKGSGQSMVERCDVCICLSQSYLNPAPKAPSRMVDGSYFLITPRRIDFWGNHLVANINPNIICHSATGAMREVKKRLILTPPDPPWMFISFAKAPITARGLAITEDNSILRFSGKTTLDERVEIHELNRNQVMDLIPIGLTDREWQTYLNAYANGNQDAFAVMEKLANEHPKLHEVRYLPPLDSPEFIALNLLLRKSKEAA